MKDLRTSPRMYRLGDVHAGLQQVGSLAQSFGRGVGGAESQRVGDDAGQQGGGDVLRDRESPLCEMIGEDGRGGRLFHFDQIQLAKRSLVM